MNDVRSVVAALHRIPQLATLDEQSLLSPQWSTLETIFSNLFLHTPQLADITTFIQQRQHDRSLERLHPTPASLAVARDREALYRQLVVELVYGQLYGVGGGGGEGKRKAAGGGGGGKVGGGGVQGLLGEKGEAVRVVGDLVKRVLGGGGSEEKEANEQEEQQRKTDRRDNDDEKKPFRDDRKHAESNGSSITGSTRKKATPSSPAPSDRDDRRPRTAAPVSGDKRSAEKPKPAQPAPAPKSAAARRRAEEEREREAREERERLRREEMAEEEEKMVEMREMMRQQQAIKDAKRSEHTLRNKPLPHSPSSDIDNDDTQTTHATRRPLTAAAARQPPAAARGRVGGTATGEVVMLERQLKEEKEKVAALERRVREMEALITDSTTPPANGEDGWRQQLLLHAQCQQWRRHATLLQSAVDGKRQVMDELRTVCEWMREGGKRLRRLEKSGGAGGGGGEEEARRLVSGVTGLVSELVGAADEAMKRIESLDQHTNTLSTASSAASAASAASLGEAGGSLPAGVMATLTTFASRLQSAHPLLMELQQVAHVMQLDGVVAGGSRGRKGDVRAAEAAEQLTALADESRKLGQLLLPYSQLAYSASSSANSSTPLASSLSSSLSSTPLSATERRSLLAIVSTAERLYTTDLHTTTTHLTTLYTLLPHILTTATQLTTQLHPLLSQLATLGQASTALSNAATASSASRRIAEVMRVVGERGEGWAVLEGELKRVVEEMRRLMVEGRERIVEGLSEHSDGRRRRAEEELRDDRERDDVEEDRRWRKPSKSAIEQHDDHYAADGRSYNGRVQHDQEWQA